LAIITFKFIDGGPFSRKYYKRGQATHMAMFSAYTVVPSSEQQYRVCRTVSIASKLW